VRRLLTPAVSGEATAAATGRAAAACVLLLRGLRLGLLRLSAEGARLRLVLLLDWALEGRAVGREDA
jgi:hypothetical protein